jgi:hypothetical protein
MPTAIKKLIELSKNKDHKTIISLDQINLAKTIIKVKPKSTKQLFQILCSLNLINAALKMKERSEFNNLIYYGMLKPKVSQLLNSIFENEQLRSDIKFYITPSDNCVYIEIHDLQFSFHNVSINDQLDNFKNSSLNKPEPWREVRLQFIAGELFEHAFIKV